MRNPPVMQSELAMRLGETGVVGKGRPTAASPHSGMSRNRRSGDIGKDGGDGRPRAGSERKSRAVAAERHGSPALQ